MTPAWVCPHGSPRQTDGSWQDRGNSSREESQGFPLAAPPRESLCGPGGTQLVLEGTAGAPCPLPSPPFCGPLGFGPVGMVAAPNASQDWAEAGAQPGVPRCLGSSPFSAPPALNPWLGDSQTRVTEAPPNCSLLSAFCCSRRPGRQDPKSSSCWLPGVEGCQEEESRGRNRRRLVQQQRTEACGECPGPGWGDLGSTPGLPLLGPVPQGKALCLWPQFSQL